MYRYYGAPEVAFGKVGLSGYDFSAGEASQAQAAPAVITASDLSSALTASDPQHGAHVAAAEAPNGLAPAAAEAPNGLAPAAAEAPNGMTPAAAATVMDHAELNAHFSHPLPRNALMKIPKVVQPVTCEVCKMQLTSVNDIRSHETGRKHKKNLEKLQDSITPEPAKPPNDAVGASTEPAAVTDGVMPGVHPMRRKRSATTPEDLEAGAAEGELKICTMSNDVERIWKFVQPVTCKVCKTWHACLKKLNDHEKSAKHKKNLEKLQDSITPEPAKPPNDVVGASTEPAAAVTDGVMPAKHPMKRKRSATTPEDPEAGAAEGELKICTISNVVKKILKVVQPVTCEVCKTYHKSLLGFRDHEKSMKHKKNLEKLQDLITPEPAKPPNGDVGASTEPAAVTDGVMPGVQPMENKSSAATPEDLEAGAAEGGLKICAISNVVEKVPKVVQPVTCEVCKTYHKSLLGFLDHEKSMKHKKNLEKLQDSITPEPAKPPNGAVGASTEPAAVTDGVMPGVQPMENKSSAATPEDLEAGAAEGGLKICTISNVVKKIPKVVQPTCQVCKTYHKTSLGFRDHEKSMKHKKNLEKLQDSITPEPAKPPNDDVGASTEPAAATEGVMPAVHPMKRKRSATTPEDLEVKKRRAIDLGAPEGELKICAMCNVMSMNQKAYEEHAAGQKHKAKLQKQQQARLPDVA